MRSARLAIAFATLLAAAATAPAQDVKPPAATDTPPLPADAPKEAVPQGSGRFSITRVDGGFLRLDSVSGQVSFCSQRAVGWACQTVPEDRVALDAEIARLQAEVATLKDEIAKTLPPRPPADISPQPGNGAANGEAQLKLPTREEMERARAALQRAWRHLVDMISDIQKDLMKKG